MWYVEEEENIFHQPGLKVGAFLKILERQLKAHKRREGLLGRFSGPHPAIKKLREFFYYVHESYPEEDKVSHQLLFGLTVLLLELQGTVKENASVCQTVDSISQGFPLHDFNVFKQLKRINLFDFNYFVMFFTNAYPSYYFDYALADAIEPVINNVQDAAVQKRYIDFAIFHLKDGSDLGYLFRTLAEVELLPTIDHEVTALLDSLLQHKDALACFVRTMQAIRTIKCSLEKVGIWAEAKSQIKHDWSLCVRKVTVSGFFGWVSFFPPPTALCYISEALKCLLGEHLKAKKFRPKVFREWVKPVWNTMLQNGGFEREMLCAIEYITSKTVQQIVVPHHLLLLRCMQTDPESFIDICKSLKLMMESMPINMVEDFLLLQQTFPQLRRTVSMLLEQQAKKRLAEFFAQLQTRAILMNLGRLNQRLEGGAIGSISEAEFGRFIHEVLSEQTEPDSLLIQSAAAYKFWHRPSCADVEALKDRNPPVPLVLRKMLR